MDTLKIFIIEDKVEEANVIKEIIEKEYNNSIIQNKIYKFNNLEIEWVKGNILNVDKSFYFYDETVIETLKDKTFDKKGVKYGILLDTILTKEELEAISMNSYKNINLAKKIYNQLSKKNIPIYIITAIGNFDTSGLQIMGIDVKDIYVQKSDIIEYISKESVLKILDYLSNK